MGLEDVIKEIYQEVISNKAGTVADYIPQLAKVNPDLFAISICKFKCHTLFNHLKLQLLFLVHL